MFLKNGMDERNGTLAQFLEEISVALGETSTSASKQAVWPTLLE